MEKQSFHPVLLVEDHAPNALVTGIFLEEFGYQCEVASDGNIALQMWRNKPYCAILMDVEMPNMNGYAATRLIREEEDPSKKHIPIIGMTAYARSDDRDECLAAGMDDYISKPFKPEELQEKLSKFCSPVQGVDVTAAGV